MSPESVTEKVAFFVAEYSATDRITGGGGVESEGEDIEVLEISLDDAVARVKNGEIVDGKTVLLLQWAQLQKATRSLDNARTDVGTYGSRISDLAKESGSQLSKISLRFLFVLVLLGPVLDGHCHRAVG